MRTDPTLVWVSSEVHCHLIMMTSGVALHPIQRESDTPVLPHRAGTNFTPWCGEAVMEKLPNVCYIQILRISMDVNIV